MPDDPTQDPAPDPSTDPKPDPKSETDPAAEVEKWKALARKNEAQAKANAEAAKKLKELEDAGKTEVEKLSAERDTHKGRADSAELALVRLEVALEKGLTKGQAKRLVGSTREELETDADELLAELGGEKKPAANGGRPKEKLRPGTVPDAEPEETDPRKLAAQIPRR